MSVKPDLEGFKDAQGKLIDEVGEDLVWLTPQDTIWPPDTPLDPETGEPYDPTITGSGGGFASALVRAGVVDRPSESTSQSTDSTAMGLIESGAKVFAVKYQDWLDNSLAEATEVEAHAERYKVMMTDRNQLGEGDPVVVHVFVQQM